MQYVDFNDLKIKDAKNNFDGFFVDMGSGEEAVKMNISDLRTKIQNGFGKMFSPKGKFSDNIKLFQLSFKGVPSEEMFLSLVRFSVNTILALNAGEKEPRDREKRLGLPDDLQDACCDLLPLMTCVNCNCYYNHINIIIEDTVNNWEFKLV